MRKRPWAVEPGFSCSNRRIDDEDVQEEDEGSERRASAPAGGQVGSARSRRALRRVMGDEEPGRAIVATRQPRMYFLGAEAGATSPVDILDSQRFRRLLGCLAARYDHVVIDTLPADTFVGAAVVAQVSDATLFVVREGFVERESVQKVAEQLRSAGAKLVGMVTNCCDTATSANMSPTGTKRSRVSACGSKASLLSQQMADGGRRMLFQHARAGVAHDGADAFAFLGRVTVVLAFVARGLHVHLAAALGAQHGIGVDARAAGAHGLAAVGGFRSRGRVVIVGAVQRHHLGYGALFAVAAPSDLGAVLLGHVAPPGLDC